MLGYGQKICFQGIVQQCKTWEGSDLPQVAWSQSCSCPWLGGMQRVLEIPTPAISFPPLSISVCWFHPQPSSSSAFLSWLGVGTFNSLALTRRAWLCCSSTVAQLSWRSLSPGRCSQSECAYSPLFPLLLSHSQARLQNRLCSPC